MSLPATAPVGLTAAHVNFAADASSATTDDDATCTGTTAAPTAPSGRVCIYLISSTGITGAVGTIPEFLTDHAFLVSMQGKAAVLKFTWAYTAP